jgi:DNA polymerase-3 subunit beta
MLNVHLAQEELHRYAQIVSRGVSGRSTQPVQNNVYLEAREGVLRMVASDLEFIHLEAHVPAQVDSEGAITVPARLLVEVTSSLPPGDVSLEATAQSGLNVQCQKSKYEIRGLPAEDFEMLPTPDGGVSVELPQAILHKVITQTIFGVSRDETRPILTGVCFVIQPERMDVVATDTYRLAMRQVTSPEPGALKIEADQPRSAIVAARCLHEVHRLLDAGSQTMVRMGMSENLVEFNVENVKIVSRLIEGKFPSYEKVIPSGHEKVALARVAEMENALKRALIVAREDANRVVFRASGSVMTLTAEHPDVGRVEEEVEVELEGEEVEIAFNARYLLDVLEPMETDRVRMELSGALNAGTIRPEGDEEYLYVLMPMQILSGR